MLPMLILAAFAVPTVAMAQAPAPAQAPKPAVPRPAQASPTAQPTLLGQFGDWRAYTATPGGRKVCFALSKPTSSQDIPPKRRTAAANPVYMFVSTRPSEKVKDEVSILVTGYEFKPSTDASLAVGSANFAMNAQNKGAWVNNSADEARLLDTMRKGAETVIKATTSKGTQTTDTFSLKGLGQALDRVAQECP